MQQDVLKLKVYYPGILKAENIIGIIDQNKRFIEILEVDNKHKNGFNKIGLINIQQVRKIDIIEKIGCINDSKDDVKCII